ncbi:MAG: hypothetical protein KF745_05895 [Phycisphaeraceae bacterium]|nr:hypothetical protein [Phycisphaeraceae bacterium]
MSQKWLRSKQWDDEHIPRALWPVKFVLRALSSIPLAVVLLSLVAVYGTLASVPVGMLAQIPTYLIIIALFALVVVVGVGLPILLIRRGLAIAGAGPAHRFPVLVIAAIGLAVASVYLWQTALWPRLRFDPGSGTGLMLFADFCQQYRSTTLRRIPGMEMSELEFYAWWPLRVVLLLFVVNMVVATVRRIEFIFPNIGVLTVHTGIVTIALGSIFYQGAKQEGDMLLRAGPPDDSGRATPGQIEDGFYDREEAVLWLASGARYEQRPVPGLPRYNDYALNVLGTMSPNEAARSTDRGRSLEILLETPPTLAAGDSALPAGFDVSIVGFASYANLQRDYVAAEKAPWASLPTDAPNPLRLIELISTIPDEATGTTTPRHIGEFRFLPVQPAMRYSTLSDAASIEYTRESSESRWRDLTTPTPPGAAHALIVEVPGSGARQVIPIEPGAKASVAGYGLEVQQLLPQPPFPIITPGYENAASSVAIVRVTPPDGPSFSRWVYSRFPEISQDMLDETNDRGMPKRRDPDPAIRLSYIDATRLRVHIEETAVAATPGDGNDPVVRAVIRAPWSPAPNVVDSLKTGSLIPVAPLLSLKLGERYARAVSVETPTVVPDSERERDSIGSRRSAAIAVRVRETATGWSRTVWVPFTMYLGIDTSTERRITLPDGRPLTLVFGRRRYELPGLSLQLAAFEMIPYPHSDTPRDYKSDLIARHQWRGANTITTESTSLNNPLKTSPFFWSPKRSWIGNALDWTMIRFSPLQYKFSQVGWDQSGWTNTTRLVEQGQLARPYARFTILGVGNNPGIYVIAAGAVMMSVGIPWAFYVKPWILKRRKKKLQAALAAGMPARSAVQSRNGARPARAGATLSASSHGGHQ